MDTNLGFSPKLFSLDFSNTLKYFLVKYLWSDTSLWVFKHRPGLGHIEYSHLYHQMNQRASGLPWECKALIYMIKGRGGSSPLLQLQQILTHVLTNCGQIWQFSSWFLSTELGREGQSWPGPSDDTLLWLWLSCPHCVDLPGVSEWLTLVLLWPASKASAQYNNQSAARIWCWEPITATPAAAFSKESRRKVCKELVFDKL